MGTGREREADELIAALEREDPKLVPTIAVLWTWLDARLQRLGSATMKAPEIIELIKHEPRYRGLTEEVRQSLRDEPVLGAAKLLARAARSVPQAGWPIMRKTDGFTADEKVLVCERRPEFVEKAGGVEFPPTARAHPSLTTLAPNLTVSPVDLGGIKLTATRARGKDWESALGPIERALAHEGDVNVTVHLDTLGQHGLSGWEQEKGDLRGHFGPPDCADGEACRAAAVAAVERASKADGASILVLPELGLDPVSLDAVIAELRKPGRSPALTVAGLRHTTIAEGDAGYSKWVNEAVVLGPRGQELWRHRKLTDAGSDKPMGEYDPFVEAIRLGEEVKVIQTQIGTFAVLICLDTFGTKSRERLAKSPANVVLVPSLSHSVKPHRESLGHVVKELWGAAFVCNRSPLLEDGDELWNGDTVRSFWVVAVSEPVVPPAKQKPAEDHPSFVFKLPISRPGKA
jgi:hypothetical protein